MFIFQLSSLDFERLNLEVYSIIHQVKTSENDLDQDMPGFSKSGMVDIHGVDVSGVSRI